jgi:hypothetical protein
MPKKRVPKKTSVKPKAKRGLMAKAKASAQDVSVSGDFAAVFAGLKKVMSAFEPELRATADEPRKYNLVTKANSRKSGPMFFGAVIMGKAYVCYHLWLWRNLLSCADGVRLD